MATIEEKKEFALKAIRPYAKNRDLCGYDSDRQLCEYVTNNGRKCVAGQFLINPYDAEGTIDNILFEYSQNKVFVPEACDILDTNEWKLLQDIHDAIATAKDNLVDYIAILGLFTYEEMMAE
jgi:hypothetical protein